MVSAVKEAAESTSRKLAADPTSRWRQQTLGRQTEKPGYNLKEAGNNSRQQGRRVRKLCGFAG